MKKSHLVVALLSGALLLSACAVPAPDASTESIGESQAETEAIGALTRSFSENGFNFKYPANWKMTRSENGHTFVLTSPSGTPFSTINAGVDNNGSVFPNPFDVDNLDSWGESMRGTLEQTGFTIVNSPILNDDNNVITYVNSAAVERDGKVFSAFLYFAFTPDYVYSFNTLMDIDTSESMANGIAEMYTTVKIDGSQQTSKTEEGIEEVENEIVEQGNQEESTETIPVEEPSASVQTYGEGSYRIGQDLPAGEYYFTGKGGFISLYSNTAKDDLLDNGFFDGHYYMTVSDGQYLQVDDATFQLASEAQHTLADTVTEPNSMYKIGVDLVAGEYALTATNRGGFYSVYSSSDPLTSELLTNDFFEVNAFGVFSDGQYVEIEDATGGLAQ